jgi:ABC-type arginine/histidine transport system permease subunit
MKSLIDILTWVVGLAATVYAIYQYYKFATFPNLQGGHTHLWLAIAATVVAFICALIFFVRRVNKEEEIHITQ